METVDAMELSAAEGLLELESNSSANATETAMRQLSLEAGGASSSDNASPQRTDDGSSHSNTDEDGEDEKESVTGFIENVVGEVQEKETQKVSENQPAVIPSVLNVLAPVDAEADNTRDAMDEDVAATPKVTTNTLDSVPPVADTPIQVAMDEDPPVTEPAALSTSDASEKKPSTPKATTPTTSGWGVPEESTTTAVAMEEDAPITGTSALSSSSPLKKKPSTTAATASGWGPPEKSTTKPANGGWGVSDDSTTKPSSNGWGAPTSDTTKENPFGAPTTTTDSGGWGSNGSNGNSGRWGSGDSGRGFDHGGRGGYRDRDSPRKGPRSSSFNSGFGPQEGERKFGHGRFASGSNAELLLPPLGRGRASPMKGGPRKVGYEPYPVGGRREVRSIDDSGPALEYTDDGRFDDTVVQVEAPMALIPAGEATRETPMSAYDIASFKTAVMGHIKNLQKHQEERFKTHDSLKQSSRNYKLDSHQLDEQVKAEEDLQKKFKLLDQRAELRSKALHDEQILLASLKLTDMATQGEIDGIFYKIGDFLVSRTTACIQDLLRSVSRNGAGEPCDVEAVIERCLTAVAPRLLKDQMSAQEGAQQRLEQKQVELEEALKAKDTMIHEMAERLKRLEDKLECQSGLATTNSGADQPKGSSSWWFRK